MSQASQHVMRKLKLLMANSPRDRPEMDHRDSIEDSHSTATGYRDDNAPSNQTFI